MMSWSKYARKCSLDIGEWSLINRVKNSDNGMFYKPTADEVERRTRGSKTKAPREFLQEYINNLQKLPSQYCRKDTTKLYHKNMKTNLL